ncbi:MAG: murein hydrolase activator EnvC family protein [Actinomycetota bacterium]
MGVSGRSAVLVLSLLMASFALPRAYAATPDEMRERAITLQGELDALAQAMGDAETQLTLANEAIDQHSQALAKASQQLQVLKDSYARRSSQMYIEGSTGVIETLSQESNIDVFVDKLSYLDRIRESEEGTREQYVALERESALDTQDLEQARAQADAALRAQMDRRAEFDAKLKEFQSLVGLTDFMRFGLRASRGTIPGFHCPIDGPHAIDNNFGAPRPGGPHQGDDMPAEPGTPLVAVLDSHVVDVVTGNWMGIGVIIRDGLGNEYWYAHLSYETVSVGQSLAAGEQLGRVGCTGNCTGPHLHFEYHPHGGPAQDPYKLLHAVC